MATLSLLRFAPLPPRHTSPSLSVNTTLVRPNPSIMIRPRLTPISASNTDRLLSAVSYTLPFFNSLTFCRFLISHYPPLASLASRLPPWATNVHSVVDLAAFYAVFHSLAQNPKVSAYVRFNARQALFLDVALNFLQLFERVLGIPSQGVGVKLVKFVYGAIFVLGFASFVYNVLCCVVGHTPYLPFVSSFAKSLF